MSQTSFDSELRDQVVRLRARCADRARGPRDHRRRRGRHGALSGTDSDWMGVRRRSVPSGAFVTSAVELVERARERAVCDPIPCSFPAHESTSGRNWCLRSMWRAGPVSRTRTTSTATSRSMISMGVVSRHGLIRDEDGRVTLRATTMSRPGA